MNDNILEVKNLTKDYSDFVLNDLSFTLRAKRTAIHVSVKQHPGIKPEHMITNMLKKSNIKHSTYKNNYYLKSTKWKYIRYFYEMYSDAVICLQAEDERTTYNNY